MSGYKDLKVWHKSMDLVTEVYRLVKILPREELYGLSDQMRRAAVSVPSNIAEGQERGSAKEFRHFLMIAQGSRAELETQIEVCIRLGFLSVGEATVAETLCDEISRMLRIMCRKLDTSGNNSKLKTHNL